MMEWRQYSTYLLVTSRHQCSGIALLRESHSGHVLILSWTDVRRLIDNSIGSVAAIRDTGMFVSMYAFRR